MLLKYVVSALIILLLVIDILLFLNLKVYVRIQFIFRGERHNMIHNGIGCLEFFQGMKMQETRCLKIWKPRNMKGFKLGLLFFGLILRQAGFIVTARKIIHLGIRSFPERCLLSMLYSFLVIKMVKYQIRNICNYCFKK